jgi:hypothetical protein
VYTPFWFDVGSSQTLLYSEFLHVSVDKFRDVDVLWAFCGFEML